ncbi:MAG: hypothetical protein QOI11_3766, partial [Candidatus Eremiobacteraeota bacterium]|nr:hypothetical protein [Candidatus Eremiobacteraeota bacterium]
DGGAASPLTLFVKDLLGLDELEALLDGLAPVRDVRNLRNTVPQYRDAEQRLALAERRLKTSSAELSEAATAVDAAAERLSQLLGVLKAPTALVADPDKVEVWLDGHDERPALAELVGVRQELEGMATRAAKLPSGDSDRASVAAKAASARRAADRWSHETGAQFDALLDELRKDLPRLPAASADPTVAHRTALDQVHAELERFKSVVAADDRACRESERVEAAVTLAQRGVVDIDAQIASAGTASATRELATALAALIPHVHTQDCPVCGRDFSEVSKEPLAGHLATRVSELGQRVVQLEALSHARISALADVQELQNQLKLLASQRLAGDARTAAQGSMLRLEDAQRRLLALRKSIGKGAGLLAAAVEAQRDLTRLEQRERTATEVFDALEMVARSLGQRPGDRADAPNSAIAALQEEVASRIEALERRQELRGGARRVAAELHRAGQRRDELKHVVEEATRDVNRIQTAINEAGKRRGQLRAICRDLEAARTRIIRRVFTSSLNEIWRDLFIRLAPEEPFIPFFDIPEEPPVTATLQTVHWDGARAGSPGSMLSAGNLNTAALTLFLALHLSVEQRLPWLVLDDPVQSMDEVHVAQFAALLRTLTRELDRRVVIAVHERSLFDYLALELGPGSPGESIVTVELTRSDTGTTLAAPVYRPFQGDPVLTTA